jgi:hypothetical protein
MVALTCGLAVSAVVTFVQPAAAQSTIFNIPSTDTVAPHKGYFEFDYLPQLPPADVESWQIFTPRFIVGITPKLEVGVNFATAHYSDGGGNYSLLQPNAKFKFYANDDSGLAATAGIVGYTATNHRDDITDKDWGQVYGNVSKKFKAGARITGGVWGSFGLTDDKGGVLAGYEQPLSSKVWGSFGLTDDKGGVLAGYEQPLSSKVSFVADWFSGKNFWGYFTPGISVTLPHSSLLNIGYSIGNNAYNDDDGNDSHNKALFIYYGITFP